MENANSTRVRQWGYSLDELLSDVAGRNVFEEFCEKQCCAENIRFWTACDNLHSTSLSQVPLEVHHIYRLAHSLVFLLISCTIVLSLNREFLADGCLSEINISADIKKQCTKDLVSPDRYAFTAAKVPHNESLQMCIAFAESSILFDERRYLSKICQVGVL